MKIIYFDICAFILFLIILYVYHSKKLGRYRNFRMFNTMNILSLICVVLDIFMEVIVNPLPISTGEVVLGNLISFSYKCLHNASLVVYLIYVFHITKTEYLIRSRKKRILLWLPYAVMVLLLLQNFINHNVFMVTADEGYSRQPLLILFYLVALAYGLFGAGYCIYCRRYLVTEKWVALLSTYIMLGVSVVIQMRYPDLLTEMIASAFGLLIVLLVVMRPEETIDLTVGVQSGKAFQDDLYNVLLSGERQIVVSCQIPNAKENRDFLGDDQFAAYVRSLIEAFHEQMDKRRLNYEVYYEHPENLFMLIEDTGFDELAVVNACNASVEEKMKAFSRGSAMLHPRICIIHCPEELSDYDSILRLSRKFYTLGTPAQRLFLASDIVRSNDFPVFNHLDEIMDRAAHGEGLVMYYQPIYDLGEGRFDSAEGLARIIDKDYGLISPGVFIPAAEKSGLIQTLGSAIMESVFRFVSGHDLASLGLSYVEINLSVAQCMQDDLTDIVFDLQKKYKIQPEQINFEITETVWSVMDGVVQKNLQQLKEWGYGFSLDDYGVGYSNLQRMRKLPLSLIKIDKSMVDDMFTREGSVIIQETIQMMQGINKKLVIEGVETKESFDALKKMSCDYIQGYFFSKPLPEDQFIAFLQEQNNRDSDSQNVEISC